MEITIHGEPASKGSRSGKGSAELDRWEDAVRAACDGHAQVTGPCRLSIEFILSPGKFQASNVQNPHGADLDNLVKPVLDVLKKRVVRDDGSVLELHARKRAAGAGERPGALVWIAPLPGIGASAAAPRRVEIHRGR